MYPPPPCFAGLPMELNLLIMSFLHPEKNTRFPYRYILEQDNHWDFARSDISPRELELCISPMFFTGDLTFLFMYERKFWVVARDILHYGATYGSIAAINTYIDYVDKEYVALCAWIARINKQDDIFDLLLKASHRM